MPRTQYPRALCPRMARELKTLFKMLKSWGKPGEISQSAGEMRIEMNEISIKKSTSAGYFAAESNSG